MNNTIIPNSGGTNTLYNSDRDQESLPADERITERDMSKYSDEDADEWDDNPRANTRTYDDDDELDGHDLDNAGYPSSDGADTLFPAGRDPRE